MYVTIDAAGAVGIDEPADFRAFGVRAPAAATPDELDTALRAADLGDFDGEHAWIRSAALVLLLTAAGGAGDADPGWPAMLGYARSRGWWRETDEAIRAHVERIGP